VEPAYDLTTLDGAERFLREVSERANYHPPGYQWLNAGRIAAITDMTRWPGPDRPRPTGDEALACLTLLADLRDWLAETEPRLIDAARAAGVTWEALAGVLRVGDRRAAERRADRLTRAGQPAATGDTQPSPARKPPPHTLQVTGPAS
jgi:hypothetical protein